MGSSVIIHLLLHVVLEIQQCESTVLLIFFRHIIRLHRNDYTCIGPLGIAGRIGHSVHHDGLRFGLRRHQNAARAHTEREHSPVIHLLHERILGSRHTGLPLSAVSDLVYQILRMFNTHSHCKSFGLQFPALLVEQLVNISCRMACSEDYCLCIERLLAACRLCTVIHSRHCNHTVFASTDI